MSKNAAAWQDVAKGPLAIREANVPTADADNIVIENTAIGLNPIDAKLAHWAVFPLQYPAILGTSLAGVVQSVGPDVKHFKVGDRVAAKVPAGSFQKIVKASEKTSIKLPDSISLEDGASLAVNPFVAAAWLFGTVQPLPRPDISKRVDNGKKIFISGGSSSVGGYAVQLAHQAGYTVVTTASAKNSDYVHGLGASKVLDRSAANLTALIKAEGPYVGYYDAIADKSTLTTIAEALGSNGGTVKAMLPPIGFTLPEKVQVVFHQFDYAAPENREFGEWVHREYFAKLFADGKIKPTPVETSQGLESLPAALATLLQGVSAKKLVVKL